MKSVLIDLGCCEIIAATEGDKDVSRLEYLADIMIPNSDYYIGCDMIEHLEVFTPTELLLMCKNHDIPILDDPQRQKVHIFNYCQAFEVNTESLKALQKRLGRGLAEVSPLPVKDKETRQRKGAAPKRPSPGTKTARVWDISDEIYKTDLTAAVDSKEFRNKVVDACVLDGINGSTASTQFSKWRRDLLAS